LNGVASAEVNAADAILPDLRQKHEVDRRAREAASGQSLKRLGPSERMHHLATLTGPLVPRAFEILHRAAASQGIRVEYPFYDMDVVETCLAVPSEAKFSNGFSRKVLREAMGGYVPDMVRWRVDKANFSPELLASLRGYLKSDEHRASVEGAISDFVDMDVFRKLLNVLFSDDGPSAQAALIVWRCVYLAFFLEKLGNWNELQRDGALWG
jgi:asparagine synthase (glutamine-hydrolysing)